MDTKQNVAQECLSAFKQGDHDRAVHLLPFLQQPATIITDYMTLWQDAVCHDVSLLHLAAHHGWLDIVTHACFSTPAYNNTDSLGQTPLHYAAAGGSLATVEYLINTQHCDPTTLGQCNWTLLHYASHGAHMDIIEYLTNTLGCDPKTPDSKGRLPLHIACCCGHLNVAMYFITEQRCHPESSCENGYTPLHYAAKGGHVDIIQYLITIVGCNTTVPCKRGSIPLHTACLNGHLAVVKYFITTTEQSFDKPLADKNGDTPLHYASQSGHMNIIQYLLTETTKYLNIPNYNGSLPLHIACSNGHFDIVKYFIAELNYDPEIRDVKGYTPLHLASEGGHMNIIRYLITEVGCDPAIQSYDGSVPLSLACLRGHFVIVKYFITELNFHPETNEKDGYTLLHYASQGGHKDLVQYLITELNCNPKAPTNNGALPLHIACLRGHLSVLQYFITEQNCDPEIRNKNGATSLHYASEGGHLNIVEYLINTMGCDPSIPDSKGRLPLHIACCQGHMAVIKYLLNEHNRNQKCENGSTPLHYAVVGGHLNTIQYLIKEGGCDPLIVDNSGATVLHKASYHRHIDIVKWLLHNGQINIMNKAKDGYTCIDIAGRLDNGNELQNLFQPLVKSTRKFPNQSFSKVALTGNSAAGKTTLIKVITERAPTRYFNWVKFGNVVQVDTRTSGITMSHIDSKEIGKIVVYDLAGHAEYHSSHSAVMEIVMQQSPATFIHVIDLNNTEEEITQQLHYWLNFIDSTTSATTDDESCIIVVGSHADLLTREQLQRRSSLIDSLMQRKVIRQKYKGMVAMDCRKINTRHTNRLIALLYESHQEIATGTPSISYYCHLLYPFLLQTRKLMTPVPACTLQVLITLLDNAPQGSLIPLQISFICDLLQALNDKGLIIFLQNQRQKKMSWIVLDAKVLLEDINGVLFAPEEFEGSCRVANSFGIMLSSTLKQLFPQYDLEMLVGFLEILEVCHCVNLSRITTNLLCNQALPPVEDRILFFPSLLNTQRPNVTSSKEGFSFGWCLKVRNTEDQFFTSRFLHVLLLRLAYTFPLKNKCTTTISHHECTCNVWINGISWDNEDGIRTVVELIDQNQCIVVVMSHKSGTRPVEYSKHRSAVIRLILDLHQQLCSNIDTEEYLIAHSLLRNWPADTVTTPSTSHLYPIENVASSMLRHKPYILSCTSISSDLHTEQILLFEPYHLLSPSSVCELMDEGDEVISQGVLRDVKIRCQLQWLEVQSHSSVKKHVDDMSIFAGRNPLVSITVQL